MAGLEEIYCNFFIVGALFFLLPQFLESDISVILSNLMAQASDELVYINDSFAAVNPSIRKTFTLQKFRQATHSLRPGHQYWSDWGHRKEG